MQGEGLVFILKRASKEEGGDLEDEKTSSLRRRMRKLRRGWGRRDEDEEVQVRRVRGDEDDKIWARVRQG